MLYIIGIHTQKKKGRLVHTEYPCYIREGMATRRAALKQQWDEEGLIEPWVKKRVIEFFSNYYDHDTGVFQYWKGLPRNVVQEEDVELKYATQGFYFVGGHTLASQYYIEIEGDEEEDEGEDEGWEIQFFLQELVPEHKKGRVKLREHDPVIIEGRTVKVYFEYTPDYEGTQKTYRDEAESIINKELPSTLREVLGQERKIRGRTPLGHHLLNFTRRRNRDYFIHKDLGGFLRRELDFYIKNEVMHLVDLENASGEQFEGFLNKIRALRTVAHDIIDFLAQLENFQKKLWLKKKFVVETNYCITLDRIPEPFYPEIAANQAQIQEWIDLFAIDDLAPPPYSTEFLKENDKLVVDTRFFDEDFKARLIATIDDFDEQCDGLLINSENFQALRFLDERYRKQVQTIYIDPPYNTGSDSFLYKDSYKHSSWLSLMKDRLSSGAMLLNDNSFQAVSIDEREQMRLSLLLKQMFHGQGIVNLIAVKMSEVSGVKMSHKDIRLPKLKEYVHLSKRGNPKLNSVTIPADSWNEEYKDILLGLSRSDRAKINFIVEKKNCTLEDVALLNQLLSKVTVRPVREIFEEEAPQQLEFDAWRQQNAWRIVQAVGSSSVKKYADKIALKPEQDIAALLSPTNLIYLYKPNYNRNTRSPRIQFLFADDSMDIAVGDMWSDIKTTGGVGQEGNVTFKNGKKPEKLMDRILRLTSNHGDLILDYFAGSGTTCAVAHKTNRRWVGVEHDTFFERFTLKRIKNVLGGDQTGVSKENDWLGGGLFKYIRLESYEDALNNLSFHEERSKAFGGNQALKRDYTLRYMLDVETKGSDSLLNIDRFADPTNYTLMIKKPGSLAQEKTRVDLVETFNYLIGLRVVQLDAPEIFDAKFHRPIDPELPEDQHTKLEIEGGIEQVKDGPYWFRTITGWVPADPENPNSGERENVLVVWRKLTGELEKDNAVLDAYFEKKRINTRDFEFDVIYVNGSNNLPNLRRDDESWKVRLLEEEFMTRMWEDEDLT